jgi:hypothetical protein
MTRRGRALMGILLVSMGLTGCETERPASYLITGPTPPVAATFPTSSSTFSRWDSAAELREWVENPLTEGPYSLGSEAGLDFIHADLRPLVPSRLHGPTLVPIFTGLRLVQVRVRYTVAANDTQSGLNNIGVFVDPTIPVGLLLPSYFSQARGDASAWQLLDLQPEARGYPLVIDARWAYLSVGRRGDIGVDIDWIEFVR